MANFITNGIDSAWSKPVPSRMKGAGAHFFMGYSSGDNGKNLTPGFARQLDSAGVPYGLVRETTANRALSGFNGGAADARAADGHRRSLGYPDMPVFFAVDFDAQGRQLVAVGNYIKGAVSVLGFDKVGAYGGYFVIQYLAENNICRWHWQTYAWSRGLIFGLKALAARPAGKIIVPNAHVYQFKNDVTVAGASCDWDKITAEGMGALRGKGFKPPAPPKPRKFASRTLKQGDTGDDVRELQNYLDARLTRKVVADGVYGPATETAKAAAMYWLGWPTVGIRARSATHSIGVPGQKTIKDPARRTQSYKNRAAKRRKALHTKKRK